MALLHSFEKSGNILFKYRGQIPLFIFLLGIPFICFMDYGFLSSYPCLEPVLAMIGVLISISGIVVRAYTIGTTPSGTSGRNTDKQVAQQLNTKGIYSIVRHPLYLGNYLIWAGLLIFSMNISLFLIASLLYWLYYERIMYAEERFLENKFGDKYMDWSLKVPAFIPDFKKFEKSEIPFSFKSVLRREYSGLFAIALAYTFVDFLRYYIIHHEITWKRPSLFCLCIIFILMITLRTLKHHTKLLNAAENRD